ncbi:MAG: family 43 glycosylhydrolase [Promethearchaeota archaeon]
MSLDEIWIRDPNIHYSEGKYYMTGTTAPSSGFLGYSSPDLEHWKLEGYIYQKNESNKWASSNFWAPEIVQREGKHYLFFTGIAQDTKRGTGVAIADTPAGPFVDLSPDPLTPKDWHCLDGHLFKDIDGKEYLIFVHEWIDGPFGEMWIQQINENYTSLVGNKTYLFKGTDAPWSNVVVDGPAMIYHEGVYYLFWSSYNNDDGYCCGYAYSQSILGPYHQSAKPVIRFDGGHVTIFHENGTERLLITFHRPNSGGLERAKIRELRFTDGQWTIPPEFRLPSVQQHEFIYFILLIALAFSFIQSTIPKSSKKR